MLNPTPPFDRREAHRLLTRLLDLPPEDRPAALDTACDDEALRRAVRLLLQGAEAPSSPFDPGSVRSQRLWSRFTKEGVARESPFAEGTLVGPYRILEEIERGGMAVVYRAERVDGEFTREVAVKVLRRGLDPEGVTRRFEQERQILADLEHPNIARLYDAGRAEDGRPYIVMELIEGVPIDRYCDEHRLSVNERLDLFCVVAGAVDYAHQNLVVHRDLKPSNILVSGAGEVTLLDFGIAQILNAEAGGNRAAPTTRTLLRMMTPEYASPEQVRGERVTTASDVYQLGLLLYKLLTGRRPYAVSDRSPGEIERMICEQVPPRPSTAVFREDALKSPSGASDATVEEVCRALRSSPVRLRRRLRGDLDNIVLMALRKEPERRYRTADRLAQDIHGHLNGLPVAARPDTWSYRSRKFLQRHAIGATTAGLVLIFATGMTGFYMTRIQNERNRALTEAVKAEQMSQFVLGLFRSADPRETQDAELSAQELLDRGVERASRELTAQPEIQADMFHALGRTYLELGLYNSAEKLLNRALEQRRRHLDVEDPEVARILGDLGLLQFQQGEYTRARERLEAAVRIFGTVPSGEVSKLASVLDLLGQTHTVLGEHRRAQATLDRALEIERHASGEGSEAVGEILHSQAMLFNRMGDLARAEQLYERALVIFQRARGPDHPNVGRALLNLATVQVYQGKLSGVEARLRRSLVILESAYGPSHAKVGAALNNLGHFLIASGRSDEAIEVVQRAFEVLRDALEPNHPNLAVPLVTLGEAYQATGRLREAQRYYQQSVTVREEAVEARVLEFDPVLAYSLIKLGRVEAVLGNRIAAEQDLNHALEIWRKGPVTIHPELIPVLVDLGSWLANQRRCVEAMPLLNQALQIERAGQLPSSLQVAGLDTLLEGCIAEQSGIVVTEALD